MKKIGMLLCAVIFGISLVGGSVHAGVPSKGDKAVSFPAKDMSGQAVELSSVIGTGPVLMVFFATWCPACVHEIPELMEVQKTYAEKGLKVIAVSLDEKADVLKQFIEGKGITYTVWHDSQNKAGRLYGIMGIPTNILIDKSGKITYREHRVPMRKDIETILN